MNTPLDFWQLAFLSALSGTARELTMTDEEIHDVVETARKIARRAGDLNAKRTKAIADKQAKKAQEPQS